MTNAPACSAIAEAATPNLMPRDEYEKRLDVVRLQGFEEMPSFQIAGVHNVSFPILDVGGRAVAAMTMPFLRRSDITSDLGTARDVLREGAANLSRLLGHPTDSPSHGDRNSSRN